MNIKKYINFLSFVCFVNFVFHLDAKGKYHDELEFFKQREDKKLIFDEDAHQGLARINANIDIYKKLSCFQRFVRSAFLMFDVIIVTEDTMPELYAYVDDLCKKQAIATPTIFVTRKETFFNAAAQKLLASSGGIIIGQKLLSAVSDEELEAVVAHEIGHIKHNHINKLIGLKWFRIFIAQFAEYYYRNNFINSDPLLKLLKEKGTFSVTLEQEMHIKTKLAQLGRNEFLLWLATYYGIDMVQSVLLNKRFEKQADQYACECGKAEGLKQFFERMESREKARDDQFAITMELLEKSKGDMSKRDHRWLMCNFYFCKAMHLVGKAYRWVYHNTPFGAHPSHQCRIAAAKKYLQ